jgi:wobble nucleotide-excising tRNase
MSSKLSKKIKGLIEVYKLDLKKLENSFGDTDDLQTQLETIIGDLEADLEDENDELESKLDEIEESIMTAESCLHGASSIIKEIRDSLEKEND